MLKRHFIVAVVAVLLAVAAFASAQNAQPPRPSQTIVIEPIDATHVRLRLQGRETWTVESGGFTIQADSGSVKVIAQRGGNRVNERSVAETFELSIEPGGGLSFFVSNATSVFTRKQPAQ